MQLISNVIKITVIPVFISMIYGCATPRHYLNSNKYQITYKSSPSYATVVCNGVEMGKTPITLSYTLDSSTKATGILRTTPCIAVWRSGYKKLYSSVVNLKKLPYGASQTAIRPYGPGYKIDALYEREVDNRITEGFKTLGKILGGVGARMAH
ncbi:MAG: hypothetical protein D6732_19640 [Methanobacteriota archaeon]|nr:MAG: hypothetical protein D6732_19640 [Euryarchaeota archaeon]